MSLLDDLLPVFGTVRAIPGSLGLNPYSVEVIVTTWTGERPGLGTQTQTVTAISENGQNPDVEEISTREILASGGLYRDQDLRVGPITPPWTAIDLSTGGTALTTLDPTLSKGQSVRYRLKGPGLPVAGALYEKVQINTTDPTGYTLVIRKTAQVPA